MLNLLFSFRALGKIATYKVTVKGEVLASSFKSLPSYKQVLFLFVSFSKWEH